MTLPVHMNGRIYDPRLGRMLQADPFVQDPRNSQSLNRYTYVLNNPLSYTDPSGYFIKELVHFVAAIVRVVYAWEDPSAWVYLAAAAKNLAGAFGKQQSGVPTGVVAGAFINGFTVATETFANVARHQSSQEPRSPGERTRLATVGLTDSPQSDGNFKNGAAFNAFAYTLGEKSQNSSIDRRNDGADTWDDHDTFDPYFEVVEMDTLDVILYTRLSDYVTFSHNRRMWSAEILLASIIRKHHVTHVEYHVYEVRKTRYFDYYKDASGQRRSIHKDVLKRRDIGEFYRVKSSKYMGLSNLFVNPRAKVVPQFCVEEGTSFNTCK